MPVTFEEHTADLLGRLGARRDDLCQAISALDGADLQRARRGGWAVSRVLEHIVDSEWHYARLILRLRASEAQIEPDSGPISDCADAVSRLARSRAALQRAVEGITEEDFYRLVSMGREEYSIVSVLENVEQHDIEHSAQIRSIVDEATP